LAHIGKKETDMEEYLIKRILVPIDFSTISLHSLHHAERIATRTRAHIRLLNVVEQYVDTIGADPSMIAPAMDIQRKVQAGNSKALEKIAHAARKRSNLQVDAGVRVGRIAATISRTARDTHADLVIMGTHGASGFVERLLGSTTYRVAGISKIPILSVHKRLRSNRYSNLIYPVRERAQAMEKFPHALTFASLFNTRVHVVGHLPAGNKPLAEKIRALCVLIEKKFAELGLATKRAFTTSDEFAETIIRYANVYSSSLVVIMQDHDFRLVDIFRGSFTKKMLHKVLSPVLTVPSRK
jgi:nucleotide-binding universal stress UspA family protein